MFVHFNAHTDCDCDVQSVHFQFTGVRSAFCNEPFSNVPADIEGRTQVSRSLANEKRDARLKIAESEDAPQKLFVSKHFCKIHDTFIFNENYMLHFSPLRKRWDEVIYLVR